MTTVVEQTYTSMQVVQLTGCTYRQLDHAVRRGHLPETANGFGSRRRFTHADLETVLYAVGLQRVGFTARASLRIAARLVEDGGYTAAVNDVFGLRIGLV